ncbi:hypothetical protein DFH27DRAFT_606725 [Peziza echinospora]|nr:hypothetical protein DFH27DRAFT_606725 [Peziza echinospora]
MALQQHPTSIAATVTIVTILNGMALEQHIMLLSYDNSMVAVVAAAMLLNKVALENSGAAKNHGPLVSWLYGGYNRYSANGDPLIATAMIVNGMVL